MRTVLHVPDLCCPTEEQLIRARLAKVSGIENLQVNLLERDVRVEHRLPDERELISALASIGMAAEIRGPGASETVSEAPAARFREWVPLGAAGLCALAAESAGWLTGAEASAPVVLLSLAAILIGGRETLRRGFYALRSFTLNINFLMSIAILGAVAIGEWPEAAMVTVLFALAEEIEAHSLDRARNAVRSLMELSPQRATLRTPGGWREVPAAEVPPGSVLRVRPGERVPLDGTVVAGRSAVDEAPITGESIPAEKGAGDPVFAGTVNGRGVLEVEVTAAWGNTTLDRIVRSVQEAQAQRAPTQRAIDRFARVYTPAVVALAVGVATVPPLLLGASFPEWLYRALVLLVISCPCALVLSTPVTVVSGLAAAARAGILVKGGVYLEEVRRLRVLALDKTGTLTRGRPEVTDLAALNGAPAPELLRIAASLNAHSEHPVAGAVVSHWLSTGGDPAGLLSAERFEVLVGRGASGEIAGRRYYVGNHRLADELGVATPAAAERMRALERQGKTAVLLSDGREPLLLLGVADQPREDSAAALRELHALGVRTVMLTGDNRATAEAVAAHVGIDDARGGLLPEEKLAAIEELLRVHRHVGMVGDGINDAPALARASVGFAMGAAGTDTALETADVALMGDDLRGVPELIRLSRRTARILAQNIALSVGIKAVFFALALGGAATLWMAVFADMGASLLVVFNGLRLLAWRPAEAAPKPGGT
ncbi:MAG: heavy metal translocating P-type ATPase [Armatimonadota bacterium]